VPGRVERTVAEGASPGQQRLAQGGLVPSNGT
jgi:hypothetical protein